MTDSNPAFPPVPLTLEGSYALHQFFRFDWKSWRALAPSIRQKISQEAAGAFLKLEKANPDAEPQTALFSQLGHKSDLILLHFRPTLEALNQAELDVAQTALSDFLIPTHSYVSVVELGLYESTTKVYESAADLEPHSEEWQARVTSALTRPAAAMAPRLHPTVPSAKALCFYPMNRLRGENKNWYTLPFEQRQRMMHDHGLIGRRYAGQVRQIVTGSIGLDDWEWGVSLFAEDPVVFKKLIYEMRFDEVSAVYGLFGEFFVGLRLEMDKLGAWLRGHLELPTTQA